MARAVAAKKRPSVAKRPRSVREAVGLAMADEAPQVAKPSPEEQVAMLQALTDVLVKTRKEAIDGRKDQGIEQIWIEDDEHYEGIDDENRDAKTTSTQSKPPFQRVGKVTEAKSTVFPNITGPYVDIAVAKVSDILLPTDAKGWSIKPTPIPELIAQAKGKLPVDVIVGMAKANVPEQAAVQVAQTEQAAAQALIEEAKDRASRAEKRIDDWQIEGQYHAELRKVIEDAGKAGTGVLKGPVPEPRRQQMYRDGELIIEEIKKPVSKHIDYWNCFPDPGCGQSIHKGKYHWERDHVTGRQLDELKRSEGYIGAQIDLCIKEGPGQKSETRKTAEGKPLDDKNLFEIWYYYGYATREDLEAAGWLDDPQNPAKIAQASMIPVVFTMVNDRVIKGTLSHLDTGEFPYDYMPWRRKKNMPWGAGVARQVRTPQQMITATVRTMLTNGGRAAGPIFIMRKGVQGADGNNNITPWKVFYVGKDDTSDDVAKAMRLIEIPDRQQSLQNIVNMAMKMAEDVTGLPLLLQGQIGGAPDTLGGQLLVDRNASAVLRRIARTFDDCITEPHIRRYYTYLLLYGEDDFEKGEFVIDARGSTALVQREIDREEAAQLLKLSVDPRYGLDPKKTMTEKLRADNRNPTDFQYSEEDQNKIDKIPRQPPIPVQVAQIKAEADAKLQAQQQQFEAQQRDQDRKVELIAEQINEHIEEMKLTGAKEINFDTLRVELSEKVMALRTQTNLSTLATAVDVHKHETPKAAPQVVTPPTEPAGRAPAGQAFAR